MAGISNEEIVKYFEKITDIDLKKILSVFFLQTILQNLSPSTK